MFGVVENAPNNPKAKPTTTNAIITEAITNINAVTAPLKDLLLLKTLFIKLIL
jgi:hypothetical protein